MLGVPIHGRGQQAAAPYSRSWDFPTFKYHFKPKRVHTLCGFPAASLDCVRALPVPLSPFFCPIHNSFSGEPRRAGLTLLD
jgi:hypothetical protein